VGGGFFGFPGDLCFGLFIRKVQAQCHVFGVFLISIAIGVGFVACDAFLFVVPSAAPVLPAAFCGCLA
jgi:hypothetical protein